MAGRTFSARPFVRTVTSRTHIITPDIQNPFLSILRTRSEVEMMIESDRKRAGGLPPGCDAQSRRSMSGARPDAPIGDTDFLLAQIPSGRSKEPTSELPSLMPLSYAVL